MDSNFQKLFREGYFLVSVIFKLLVALFIFSLVRMLFISFNQHLFAGLNTTILSNIFLQGLRFDLVAVTYINLPVILSYLLPIPQRSGSIYKIFQWLLFILCNGIALFFEFGDMAYYPYSLKRSNAGDFGLLANTTDLFPSFAKEYWYLVLLFLGLLFILGYFGRYWVLKSKPAPFKIIPQTLVFLLGASLTLVAVRGGFQMRPLMPLNANNCVDNIQHAPLVYPTSLSILFSAQQRFLTAPKYFSKRELYDLVPRPRTFSSGPMKKDNICIIVLESFGKEYSLLFNGKKGYMPFLDSLMREGFYCEQTYANGLRSTQGIAAISAGIPALMDDPVMFSAYQSNALNGIATLTKKKGYTSGFFHGSNPGSMEFEDFSQVCGFDHFYDKRAYPLPADYDGQWGIWDLPFFQFTASTLNRYEQPFVSLLFSLSSHHPYEVESFYEDEYPDLDPLYRSVQYTDFALRKFFQTARSMPWFDQTLFVITADHVGQSSDPDFQTRLGKYQVPILFYKPGVTISANKNRVAQQIDIIPSILDYLDYDEPYRSFGQSIFDNQKQSYAYMYEGQLYQIVDPQFILLFDEAKTVAMYQHTTDPKLKKNIMEKFPEDRKRMERQLKAMIQRHHEGMIGNSLK